jgi:hypothetical protein
VPWGKAAYVVEGWWQGKPAFQDTWDFKNGNEYVVPNPEHPIYYHVKWTDKPRRDNFTNDRTFVYEGRGYKMTQVRTGLHDGKRWIEIRCY